MDRRRPFRAWSEIAIIGLAGEKAEYHLAVNLRRTWNSGRLLQTTPGMTLEEGVALLDRIAHEIAPHHPHLRVAGRC